MARTGDHHARIKAASRDFARRSIKPSVQRLIRGRTPVDAHGLDTLEPISRSFGLERGTPIDRYYIEAFIDKNAADIRGRTLEVASATYARRFGQHVTRQEILHASAGNAEATIVGDLSNWQNLPGSSMDCFICTQTLQFVFDIGEAVRGVHHLLKPGGTALVTMAGISQISRFDMDRWGDYWRCTTASARALFEPWFEGGIEVTSYGNRVAAVAMLNGLAVEDLPDPKILDVSDDDYQVLLAVRASR